MGTGGRLLVVLGAVAAAVALFLVVRGSDDGAQTAGERAAQGATGDDTTTAARATTDEMGATEPAPPPPPPGPREIVLRIPAGGPTGIERVEVQQGERVVLVIRSEVEDHAHLHGYDLLADVAPGRPARITFRAATPGRFELELEDRGEQFAELTVAP